MPTENEFDEFNRQEEIRRNDVTDNKYKCDRCNEEYTQAEKDKENGCGYCGSVLRLVN
jgi:late competence protein required for DNA uptake (superfamily II DNA/RNA helicase)